MLERVRSRDLFGGGAPPINGRAFYAKEKKRERDGGRERGKETDKGEKPKNAYGIISCMYVREHESSQSFPLSLSCRVKSNNH